MIQSVIIPRIKENPFLKIFSILYFSQISRGLNFLNFHSSQIPGSRAIICSFDIVFTAHMYLIIYLKQLASICMEHVISSQTVVSNKN